MDVGEREQIKGFEGVIILISIKSKKLLTAEFKYVECRLPRDSDQLNFRKIAARNTFENNLKKVLTDRLE